MKALIKEITNIQTGLFAKPMADGDLVYLQAKHFDEKGNLHSALHQDLPEAGISEKHILNPGDVLFAAKGSKNFATVYEHHNEKAVASTSFFVIRIADRSISPQYLCWFLNHPTTQILLKGKAIGTAIASISKAVLQELEICIPSIDIQHKILQIDKLRQHEKEIQQEIELLRERRIQQQILNAIK